MKDYDRPLDAEGHAALDRLAAAMRATSLLPDRVVLSGSSRTRETAFGLLERLGVEVETVIDDEIYSGGAAEYLRSIRTHGDVETLMLVGHNPSMEDLALALCAKGDPDSLDRLHAGFPTAALATISFSGKLSDLSGEHGFLESFPQP
ncbi:phosphohistidine phosphatase [Ochrobactrum sp. P6BSIII]|nr:phosphohistidine phosphatase [Ochrobactrum sp. P6BSIII]